MSYCPLIVRRDFLRLAGAGGLLAVGPGVVGRALAHTPPIAALDDLVTSLVDKRLAPGVVIALGDRGHAPRFITYGTLAFDSASPVGPDTLWRLYSQTKLVAGMSAMVLIDQGKLRLDQPVSDVLPEYRHMRVMLDPAKGLESRPARKPITIRHLITHTSGLAYSAGSTGPILHELERLGLAGRRGGSDAGGAMAPPTSLEVYSKRLAQLPLAAEPGARWQYSAGTDLIGRVVEVIAGKPFDAFLADTFFRPLAMRSTGFSVAISDIGRFASNYAMAGVDRPLIDAGPSSSYLKPPPFPSGGGGLVSTARDYDRFLAMLANRGELDGHRVLSAPTALLGMSNLLPPEVDRTSLLPLVEGQGFGAGGKVELTGPAKGTFGWGGAAGTDARVNPVTGKRAAGYQNVLGQYVLGPKMIALTAAAPSDETARQQVVAAGRPGCRPLPARMDGPAKGGRTNRLLRHRARQGRSRPAKLRERFAKAPIPVPPAPFAPPGCTLHGAQRRSSEGLSL